MTGETRQLKKSLHRATGYSAILNKKVWCALEDSGALRLGGVLETAFNARAADNATTKPIASFLNFILISPYALVDYRLNTRIF